MKFTMVLFALAATALAAPTDDWKDWNKKETVYVTKTEYKTEYKVDYKTVEKPVYKTEYKTEYKTVEKEKYVTKECEKKQEWGQWGNP